MRKNGLGGGMAVLLMVALTATAIAGGNAEDRPPAVAVSPSFSQDIVPILKRRCATCHLTGDEPGGMALYPEAAYDSLVGAASIEADMMRVEPGDPQASYLFRKLEGTHIEAGGYGDPMPLEGWPLPAADIDLFKQWIAAGAPRN